MSEDKRPRGSAGPNIRQIEDLLAHGRFSAALDAIADLRASVPSASLPENPLLLARCRALLGLGRWKEVAEVAEKKLTELYALQPNEKRPILEFHIAAGRAAWRIGRPSRAEEHFRAAYHISRWDFEDTAGMLRTRNLLGLCFLGAGELHRAASEFARGQREARESGLYHEEASFSLNLAIALAKIGRIEPAEKELARARTLFGERGHSRGKVQARLYHGFLLRIRGRDLGAAEREIRGALSEAEEHGFERERVIALEYLGDLALDRHENQTAIESFDHALVLAERMAPEGDLVPELCRRIAEIHVRIGEPNRALITCERGLRIARKINDRFEEAATYRVMAMAHLLLGHREKAVRTAEEGVRELRKLDAGYELTRLLVWAGEMLLSGGDAEERREARDYLWEARSLTMSMKLEPWLERIEKVLGVEIGAPPPVATPRVEAAEMPRGADPGCFRFGIVTADPRMIELVRILERASASRLPILVLGESGTGKELLARAAHALSDRASRVFVVGNCVALPDGELDQDLFGKDAGIETGDDRARSGLFEAASGGVIFLDEVSELLSPAQAKLLRVIEMGELRRVGGMGLRQVDVRVIAASTRDLSSLVRRGLFRDDLYYRLNGIRLEVPPLRERPGDIELIGRYMLQQACAHAKKRITLSEEAWARLVAHPWTGNVRELRAVIDRTVALAKPGERLRAEDVQLHAAVRASRANGHEKKHPPEGERDRILEALRNHGGNQSEAARSLGGMKRTTLLYKIKKLDIRPEEYGPTSSS
ncbi:MAG TPA: sigma 54-interacting transcriptional regulator [Candidatus Eisenbacteria bacterium]|nr:sigma 54-interacting transcriptional regulator [Candidatus Eisenbacteria bacterium]